MKKKTLLIILTTLVILSITLGVVFFFFIRGGEGESIIGKALQNLFPARSEQFETVPPREAGDSSSEENINLVGPSLPRLRKISASPVAGAISFINEGEQVVRYVERETGHVFDARATSSGVARITNTTLPRIREALWTPDGEYVALRYLDDSLESIQTFLAHINPPHDEEEGELVGSFFPSDIKTITLSNTASSFFYTHKTGNRFEGVEIDPKTNGTEVIFESAFGEWEASHTEKNLVLLTKPSATIPGFLYFKKGKGALTQILGDAPGLTALVSPPSEYVLWSESGGTGFKLKATTIASGEQTDISPKTLPEKCVWSNIDTSLVYCLVPKNLPKGAYPDAWYQGVVSFSDDIWEINVKTGNSTRILDIGEVSRDAIDGILPHLSPEEAFLVFINKKDSSLWSLALPKKERLSEEGAF